MSHPAPLRGGLPLTDGLGLFHGVARSQDVLRFKGHHGLHLQDGGVGQSVVHAVFSSGAKQIKKHNIYNISHMTGVESLTTYAMLHLLPGTK